MHVRVKVCGLKTPEHVGVALKAGVDAIGFVFAKKSPRYVDAALAERLLADIPDEVRKVAVFNDVTQADLDMLAGLRIDTIQAFDASQIALDQLGGRDLLTAVKDGPGLLDRVQSAQSGPGIPVLIDGPNGGGLGELGDHRRIAAVAWRLPVILAGGLDPENVGPAIQHVQPIGVDVSSGIESTRGVKDSARIRAFIQSVRDAEKRVADQGGAA